MKVPVVNEAAGSSAAATGWQKRLPVLFASMVVAGLIVVLRVHPNMKHGTVLLPGTDLTILEELCLREIVTIKQRKGRDEGQGHRERGGKRSEIMGTTVCFSSLWK